MTVEEAHAKTNYHFVEKNITVYDNFTDYSMIIPSEDDYYYEGLMMNQSLGQSLELP